MILSNIFRRAQLFGGMVMGKSLQAAGWRLLMLFALGVAQPLAQAAPLVAIDVGHSRQVPGAIGARGKPEYEFNAELAQVIHQTLAQRQVATLAIGDDGSEPDLAGRAGLAVRTAMAQQQQASFFLAVHHDSAKLRFLDQW
jgi:N-acetylmuramoyl-L-alanine amidase